MFHYLFTNDLRISTLDSSLKKAGTCILSNTVPTAVQNKSENNNINLSDIADEFNISKEHFCRIFKEYTGYRPFEYVNRVKIQKAKELLKNTSY